MKKLLFLFTVVFFVACEGPEGPMGPQGRPGEAGVPGYGSSWFTKSFTINSDEWKLVGKPGELHSYYIADKAFTELTESVYRDGTVVAYLETEKGIKNGLPYVLHTGDKDAEGKSLWTQTYSFDFYPGGIGFYVAYSDFSTEFRPQTETFHVVLMW